MKLAVCEYKLEMLITVRLFKKNCVVEEIEIIKQKIDSQYEFLVSEIDVLIESWKIKLDEIGDLFKKDLQEAKENTIK